MSRKRNCTWCGHRFGADEEVAVSGAENAYPAYYHRVCVGPATRAQERMRKVVIRKLNKALRDLHGDQP